jgi:hypothetical protein
MFKNSKNSNNKLFTDVSRKFLATKRHNTFFDMQVDWFMKFFTSKRISFSRALALLNLSLFLYANVRYGWENRWKAIEGLSYSLRNFKMKDYTTIFTSQLGSYRLDDLVLETGILATLGHSMETLYGRPFMFKMLIFSFYIGYLSSLFWVRSNWAKRDRYYVEEPYKRDYGQTQGNNYRYMSGHNFCMSLVYFYLYKNPAYRMLILPILGADMYVWGPYYSAGALTGIAAGAIL